MKHPITACWNWTRNRSLRSGEESIPPHSFINRCTSQCEFRGGTAREHVIFWTQSSRYLARNRKTLTSAACHQSRVSFYNVSRERQRVQWKNQCPSHQPSRNTGSASELISNDFDELVLSASCLGVFSCRSDSQLDTGLFLKNAQN